MRGSLEKNEKGNQTADKVLAILEYFVENPYPARLQDIAEAFDAPAPTMLRYLNSLIGKKYIYQNPENQRYALTWKICALGRSVNSNLSLRNIASPFLCELAKRFNAGVCLVVRDHFESVYLDLLDSPALKCRTLRRIGKSAPMHSTSSGKLLLSGLAGDEFDEYVDQCGLAGLTPNTITRKDRMIEELRCIRENGYAFDDEECEENVRCISVPLMAYDRRPAAAISVFNESGALSREMATEQVLPELMRVAGEISGYLGYNGE